MSLNVEQHIKKPSTWKRGLYILFYSICYQLAAAILFFIILFQFVLKLLSGDTHAELRQLSRRLATYLYQLIQFMSFNSNDKPYPYGEWPDDESNVVAKTPKEKTAIDDVLQKVDQDIDVDGD